MSLKYLYWTLKKNTHLDSFFRNFRSSCFELLFWFSSTILLSKMKYFFSTWENLSNSSCHFWKLKSVFLQILNQYSVPSNITPLYFFCSKIIYFGQKLPIKVQIFQTFESKFVKIPDVNFEVTSQFLYKFFIILQCDYTTPPYFFSSNIIYPGQKQAIKV